MNQLHIWVKLYHWRFVGVSWAVFSLWLLMLEIIPRATVVVETYHQWQLNKAEILKMEVWETQRFQLEQQITLLDTQVKALYISIPRNDQMSVILDCLQESSQDIALSLQQIKTGTPVTKNAHQEQPLSVIAKGTFHALGTFIDRLELSPYLIKVESLQIEREGKLKGDLIAALELQAIVVER